MDLKGLVFERSVNLVPAWAKLSGTNLDLTDPFKQRKGTGIAPPIHRKFKSQIIKLQNITTDMK